MSADLLWWLARASGLLLLPSLSAVLVLGILSRGARRLGGRARWVTPALHRTLALTMVGLLGLHVVTIVADSSVDVGVLDVVVPFVSGFDPFWTGLGTTALLLVVTITVSSLVRVRLGHRAWAALHALAWVVLPVAVAHGLGVGTDARTPLGVALAVGSVLAVGAAAALGRTRPAPRPARIPQLVPVRAVPVGTGRPVRLERS
ncbi:ferric reductase-like transmembrane domain-containing protein [Kineococcus gynurae]|uniref:Ferric reductase-like transmembrane domain-containing protein n=1 Tax=Kineococcus gynurae TaxID=452979 RepID=A0ABV5LP51_9ACTN